jgi:hypothetical protein
MRIYTGKTTQLIPSGGDRCVVYCDEAGYTGDHLLDADNKYFVYSGAYLEPKRAEEIVARAFRDYRLDGAEMKGAKLMKHFRGRRAIDFLVNECLQNVRLVCYLKNYALACKFYEFTFSDILSDVNSLFYSIDFHKYISNLIYLELVVNNQATVDLLYDFQGLMRRRNQETPALRSMFNTGEGLKCNPASELIFDFCFLHKDQILENLSPLCDGPGAGKWNLELSNTSLNAVLAYWSDLMGPVEVICDESKPLQAHSPFFNLMVDRKEQVYLETPDDRREPVFFNLKGPVKFERSEDHAGLQIADVFASALCYSFNHSDEPHCKELIEKCLPAISPRSIFPDFEHVDPTTINGVVHTCILIELVNRSRKGEDLTANIEELLYRLYSNYDQYKKMVDD